MHGISVGRDLEPVKQTNLFSVSVLRKVSTLLVFSFFVQLSKYLYLHHGWELASIVRISEVWIKILDF